MHGRRSRHDMHSHLREHFSRHRHSFGRGGMRARKGDVRAAILALLDERPMHGYEMIKQLEERTDGAWVPSAGSIYPTLQLLEDEGLIAGEEVDGKRRFTLTDAGREAVAKRDGPTPWDEVTTGADPKVVELKRSLIQLNHAIGQVFTAGSDEQRGKVSELLDETRRKVYEVLAD